MPVYRADGTIAKQLVKKRQFLIPKALTTNGDLVVPPSTAHLPPTSSLLSSSRGIRRRRLADSRVYKSVLSIIALRAQGCSTEDISRELGVTKNTVRTYLKRGVARGWLNIQSFDDPTDQTEHILAYKAVRNLNAALDETTDEGAMTARASDVALEVAHGVGLLKTHQVSKVDGDPGMGVALQVNVVMPPEHAEGISRLKAGSIGGAPAIEGDVMESD